MLNFFLKKSIIRLNIFLSIGFGILIGVLFPFYTLFFATFKSGFMKIIFSISCIGAGILVGLMAFMITRYTIIRVIKSVSGELKEIANGEGDLTKLIDFTSHDAVGNLIKWFNLFVVKLGKMVGSIKKNIIVSKDKSNSLTGEMNNISVSLQSVIESVQKIIETQLKQNIKGENMEHSLQVLDDSIIIVIANVMEFFNQLDTLTNIVLVQSKAVDKLITTISGVSDKIGKSGTQKDFSDEDSSSLSVTGFHLVNSTYNLVNKSKQNTIKIEEQLNKINDIAVKVNLIAINASIEASKAGDAGKGFKIVAKEISKLADLTNKFTQNIKNLLKEIEDDTDHAIGIIGNNQTIYNEILTDVTSATVNLSTEADNIKTITEDIKANYNNIGGLLVNLKEKIESLKENSTFCHVVLRDLSDITEEVKKQLELIDIESVQINNNNLNVLRESYDFEKGLKEVEEQITKYKTPD